MNKFKQKEKILCILVKDTIVLFMFNVTFSLKFKISMVMFL